MIFSLTERWLIRSWSSMSADELIFHLASSMKGANMDVVKQLIIFYYIPGFVLIILVLVCFICLKSHVAKKIVVIFSLVIAFLGIVFSIIDLDKETGLVRRIFSFNRTNLDSVDFIELNYCDASSVSFEFPEQKRNLIYIYLESMEMTFADTNNGGAFEENIIPNLTMLDVEYEDFSGNSEFLNGAYSLPSTDWTMAGMFAQSSGMPLKVAIRNDYSEIGFFPGLVTIGDVLAEAGYHQTLLIGSEAEFGGRGDFYSTHGCFDIHDYNFALENGWIPEGYKEWWGFEDSKLFEFAKEDISELANGGEPFHYVILTADTHFEDGYVCELCKDEHEGNQYANVISCSDRQVYEFVKWLMEQDFWDNTTVVLCGDHTTMDSDFCDDVPGDFSRRTFTVIINDVVEPIEGNAFREYSTLDLFPTTLAAIGVKMSSDRLGLGVNLYSNSPTIIEEYGLEQCRISMETKSDFMITLSGEGKDVIEKMLDDTVVRMEFLEDENGPYLYMWGIGNLSYQYVDDIYVDVTDTRTGRTERVTMVMDWGNEANPYSCHAYVEYSSDEKQYLEAVGYICFNGMSAKEVVRIDATE